MGNNDISRTLIIFGSCLRITDELKEINLTCFTAVIAIVLLIATVILAVIVLRNFGGGLKYHSEFNYLMYCLLPTLHDYLVSKRPNTDPRGRNAELQHRKSKSYPLGNPNRMSID